MTGRFGKTVVPGTYHVNSFLNEEMDIVNFAIVPINSKGIVTRWRVFRRLLEPGEHFINSLLEEKVGNPPGKSRQGKTNSRNKKDYSPCRD